MPFIVIVIDELAEVINYARTLKEQLLFQLCGGGRSVGIHLVVSCGRMEPNIFRNFSVRIATRLQDEAASLRLLGVSGAEYLLDKGDLLCRISSEFQRVHAGIITPDECHRLAEKASCLYTNPGRQEIPVSATDLMFEEKVLCKAQVRDRIFEVVHRVIEENMDYLADEIIDALMEDFDNK